MAREEEPIDKLTKVPQEAFRRGDRVARARVWLAFVALGIVALWAAGGYLVHGEKRYNPAPLAAVHATWENNCEVCHVSTQPLSGVNWLSVSLSDTHVADITCSACHEGAPHHQAQKPDDVAACTTCHKEHHGRDALLVKQDDQQCVSCHADLANHSQKVVTFSDVASFATNHPDFKILRDKEADPGKVQFNHQLHMMPGLRKTTLAGAGGAFSLHDIPAAFRNRYRLADQHDDDAPVRLDCKSCHRTDAVDFKLGADDKKGLPAALSQPVRGSGVSMLPITYELDCQACHPLSFQGDNGSVAVRHRTQPAEIHDMLEGYFTAVLLKKTTGFPLLERNARPLPGKMSIDPEEKKKVRDQVDERVHKAEQVLLGPGTCLKCHQGSATSTLRTEAVAPVEIPQVWLTHAVFDHAAHKALDCRECHAGAYALAENGHPNPSASMRKDDVLLPGIQTCLQCHAPASSSSSGGARFDCVECHRYHGSDDPLHGTGAVIRQPKTKITVSEFLSGAGK